MSSEVREYAAVAAALKEADRELKRFEAAQRKYQRLHKTIADAAGPDAASKTMTSKQCAELKKVYRELLECCQKVRGQRRLAVCGFL